MRDDAQNNRRDRYEAEFSNLGLSGVPIDEEYPTKFDRLLCGGIWCIIRLEYDSNSDYDSGIISADGDHLRSKKKNQNDTPIKIINLNPIQMPHVDINELKEGRKQFTKEEWMDVLLRSIGMEPDMLDTREKWLLLTRIIAEKKSGQCIGYITVDIPYPQLAIGEIGYVIGEHFQRKGYAYEAVSELLRIYFEEKYLYMMEAKYNINNFSSKKLIKKLGFVTDGILRNRRIDLQTGQRCDLVTCSICRDEYEGLILL